MKNKLIVLFAVVALAAIPASAQYYVDYFSNNPNPPLPGTPDQWIHFVNIGLQGVPFGAAQFGGGTGYICTSYYVFDQTQELLSCCSCAISPNAVASTGVKQLTANTLTGNIPTIGTIKVIVRALPNGTKTCDSIETVAIAAADLTPAAGWGQHLVVEPSGTAVTETNKDPQALSIYEASFLPATCAFVQYLGTGKGKCTCGTATQ